MNASPKCDKTKCDFLISVIVPIYNIESFLARTLDSIILQTYTNLEIIIVDDGSTDNTGEIADGYASRDGRIVVIHKENKGVSVARNIGIDQACGDYIGFVDGDDTIEPDMFEFLLNNAIEYNADISHCGHTMVTADGDIPHYGTQVFKQQDTQTGVLDLLEGVLVDPGLCTKIYKRELFDCLRLVPGLRNNEDLLINYYLFKQAKCSIFVDISKYRYIKRFGSASMSELGTHKLRDPLRVIKEIMEDSVDDPKIYIRAEYRFLMMLFETSKGLTISDNVALREVKLEVINDLRLYKKKFFKNHLVGLKYYLYTELLLHCSFAFRMIYKVYDKLPFVKRSFLLVLIVIL